MKIEKNHSTLCNMSVVGEPCTDIEERRGTCADEDTIGFRIACSVDDGVEIESDEEELEDDDMIEIGDVPAPFVVVFLGNTSISVDLSSFFCLLGDDTMTSEGNKLFVCPSNSFDCITEEDSLYNTASKK